MRYGYSMLRGEAVEAASLDYGDCETGLVVCPICKEKVFKAVRETQHGQTHYLAHHRRSTNNIQCELRVSRMTRNEIQELGNIGRGQSFEQFLANINNILLESYAIDPNKLLEDTNETLRSANFNKWFSNFEAELPDTMAAVYDNPHDPQAFRSTFMLIPVLAIWYSTSFSRHGDKEPILKHMDNKNKEICQRFITDLVDHWRFHPNSKTWKFLYALFITLFWKRYYQKVRSRDFPELFKKFYLDMYLPHGDPEIVHHMGEFTQMMVEGSHGMAMIHEYSPLRFKTRFDKMLKSKGPHHKADSVHFSMLFVITFHLIHGFTAFTCQLPKGRHYFSKEVK